MDLSAIGYTPKDFRVIQIHDKPLIQDFLGGKFKVLAIECNARASYNSPIQRRLKALFPSLAEEMNKVKPDPELLGTSSVSKIWKRSHGQLLIANMYISSGYGLGRSGDNQSSEPVNRFSEKFLSASFDHLIKTLRRMKIDPDRQIAVQRFYGGLGGVEWQCVQNVLDAVCEKHRINILAYLPPDYDTNFVRGSQ